MKQFNFLNTLWNSWRLGEKTFLCVGIDPDDEDIKKLFGHYEEAALLEYCKIIVDETRDHAACYKVNSAFFEVHGAAGWAAMDALFKYIKHLGKLVIWDAKRGDIGNTAERYATAAQKIGADAVTLNAYMGSDAINPFAEKGIFPIILGRTSNKSSSEIQDKESESGDIADTLIETMHQRLDYDFGVVVGAPTSSHDRYVGSLELIRALDINKFILIPGVGAQSGLLDVSVRNAYNGVGGFVINVSRSLIPKEYKDLGEFAKKLNDNALMQHMNIVDQIFAFEKFKEELALNIIKNAGAIFTDDHFVYASGKHGDTYINKDKIYTNPVNLAVLCDELGDHLIASGFGNVDTIVGPAMGAIKIADRIAEYMAVNTVYAEKSGDSFVFNRGYQEYIFGKEIVISEDIFTTGGSVKKVIDAVKNAGGKVVAVVGLVNRNIGEVHAGSLGVPYFFTLTSVDVNQWDEKDMPDWLRERPINTVLGKGKEYLANQVK